MSDSVAWCILAGFKITSVFARIIYHTIESMCEFAVSILQEYIYGGNKNVNFNVAKKINRRKRKSIKIIEDESRNAEPKNKNVYCKTNESIMSKSINMAKDKLTVPGQRFCFHGTDKIMECNLDDARKVTVSFDFYPSLNQSMMEFLDSPSHNATDPQKKVVENHDSYEKPKMPSDRKQANGQLNQNEIKNDCRFKYKDEVKLVDETIFITDSNMHATKNALEVASDDRDVSISGCGASYKKDGDSFSDEQHLEPSVVHLSQDPESLVDKRVTHKQDSLDSADKQWSDNDTVGKRQKQEISLDHTSDKQDSTILVKGQTRATTTINQRYIANSPEHLGKNQTTSHMEKQIQETLSEKQRSDIKKAILIHSEQYQTPSVPAPITLPESDTDKPVPKSLVDKNKKQQASTRRKNRYQPESPTDRKPIPASPVNTNNPVSESTADKNRMAASFIGKKPGLGAPTSKSETPTTEPTADTLTNNEKKHVLTFVADKNLIPALATDKNTSDCPANKDNKLVIPSLVTDKKIKPEGPSNNNKQSVNKASVQAPETNKDKPLPVPETRNFTTESPANKDEKSISVADKKPIPPPEVSEKSASVVDKKSTPECPVNKDKKRVPLPTTDKKLKPESPAKKDKKSVPAATKKLIPPPETVEKLVSESAVDTKSTPECPANDKHEPVPTTGKKLTPKSSTKKDKMLLPEPISQKNESSHVSLTNQKSVCKINIPESTIDKDITTSAIDGKPISATGDCYRVENVSEVPEKVREINEDGNSDSSLTKKFSSQTEPIDTDSCDEVSGDFNEMLEKGPSIVIAPDILLNPNMRAYDSGIFRPDVSKTEMNSNYIQDGWDDSDKYFLDYVIEREKEMGQFDPSAFKNECSNEMARCEDIKSKDENIQHDSHMYGEIIDKYNPLTEVPKYYDLISMVDSKYVLEKSRIKCYKKQEVTDNFASAEDTNNTNDPNVSPKEQRSTSDQHNNERQST